MTDHPHLIIVGGGLAGSLAALMLVERRPELRVLLIEGGPSFGGNHVWSFFDSDIPAGARNLVAALNPVRWPRHRVKFHGRQREFAVAYNAVTSDSLDTLVRQRMNAGSWRLNTRVVKIDSNGVTLESGERIVAYAVIDARGPDGPMPGLELGWQKFVGIEFAARATDPDCATVMDATVPQLGGYRFVYTLPLAEDRVLVEDTYYTNGPELDVMQVAARVREYAAGQGICGTELRQEVGVLPIVIGGDPDVFWPKDDPIVRLGLRGGFFHATTGYSFSMALRLAAALSERNDDFDGASLASWSRGKFMQHWQDMRFFRVLNRMLFDAALPEERHKIFAHFYRLPPEQIARFYAGTLTHSDKLRILSGRPPVPIGAAISALLRRET